MAARRAMPCSRRWVTGCAMVMVGCLLDSLGWVRGALELADFEGLAGVVGVLGADVGDGTQVAPPLVFIVQSIQSMMVRFVPG